MNGDAFGLLHIAKYILYTKLGQTRSKDIWFYFTSILGVEPEIKLRCTHTGFHNNESAVRFFSYTLVLPK